MTFSTNKIVKRLRCVCNCNHRSWLCW